MLSEQTNYCHSRKDLLQKKFSILVLLNISYKIEIKAMLAKKPSSYTGTYLPYDQMLRIHEMGDFLGRVATI